MNPFVFILFCIALQTALLLGAVAAFHSAAEKREEAKRPIAVETVGALPGESLEQLPVTQARSSIEDVVVVNEVPIAPLVRESDDDRHEYIPVSSDLDRPNVEALELANNATTDLEVEFISTDVVEVMLRDEADHSGGYPTLSAHEIEMLFEPAEVVVAEPTDDQLEIIAMMVDEIVIALAAGAQLNLPLENSQA